MNNSESKKLPRHNTLLRGLYAVCVLGMFTFMFVVIGGYWTKDAKTDSHLESNLESPRIVNPVAEMVEQPSVNILARNFELNLNQSIEQQLTSFWATLYDDETLLFSDRIVTDKTVYQVYYNYDYAANSVDVLLGFEANKILKVNGDKYQLVNLPRTEMLPRKSVLDSWQDDGLLSALLSYEFDYEIFQLDKQYKIISQTAFLNFK